ncbi:MAG: PEP-CTERM sorting domain-containing protein, partial [Spirulinaceae cyanobacterium]
GFLTGTALAFSAASAQAFSFQTPSDLGGCAIANLPTNSCMTNDGFTITAGLDGDDSTNPVLKNKTVNGVTGIGVNHDGKEGGDNEGVPGEVDAGEFILLEAKDSNNIFKSIELAFLYQPGVFADDVFEIAQLETALGIGTLTVTGNTTAKYKFDAIDDTQDFETDIIATSPSTMSGAGYYHFNPFGHNVVTSVKFTAAGLPGDTHEQHDYALVSAEAKDVPEPATLGALGLVAGALAATRRGKKKQAN